MQEQPFDADRFVFADCTVRVEYYYDNDFGCPWENCDGHGPVRRSSSPHRNGHTDKKPGERPLISAGRNECQFYYDWAAAMTLAKKDGWNAEPYDAPNKAARAVAADFEFLRAYLNDEWHYAGVVCKVEDADGVVQDQWEDSCWGFETYSEYYKQAGREMAEALAKRVSKEKAEALYWAERDVCTTKGE